MRKARSRLSHQQKPEKKPQRTSLKKSKKTQSAFDLKNYFAHLPTLMTGLFFSFITFLILRHVEPNSIKNLISPNTYLPFLLSLFFALSFTSSFILLNTRRGFLLSGAIILYFFLKLQQVIITPLNLFSILAITTTLELIFTLLDRAQKTKTN